MCYKEYFGRKNTLNHNILIILIILYSVNMLQAIFQKAKHFNLFIQKVASCRRQYHSLEIFLAVCIP